MVSGSFWKRLARSRFLRSNAGLSLALLSLLNAAALAAEPTRGSASKPVNAGASQPAKAAAQSGSVSAQSAIPAEEAKARELRAASIAVQQRLRAQQRAREQAQRDQSRNERCVGGQRMRRVENGWVGVGDC